MSSRSAARRTTKPRGYLQRIRIKARPERVFIALTTLKGLRGWWTTRVHGSASRGGDIRFEFEGLDEHIVMHVDAVARPASVCWTCVIHSKLDEWNGTQLMFQLGRHGTDECDLTFQHVGLTPKLVCYDDCEAGWDYFLSSLATFVERGNGAPFGA